MSFLSTGCRRNVTGGTGRRQPCAKRTRVDPTRPPTGPGEDPSRTRKPGPGQILPPWPSTQKPDLLSSFWQPDSHGWPVPPAADCLYPRGWPSSPRTGPAWGNMAPLPPAGTTSSPKRCAPLPNWSLVRAVSA